MMESIKAFWGQLGTMARAGLATGLLLIVAFSVVLASWLLRTEYEVLFAGLSAQDAAVMTAELDRMKLPYRLGAEGSSILVDQAQVHQTRLKLLGKELPLHGAVGFELFNNSDFGMTEFAQKINYQRALQGEITRTILSLAEVETARVHLAMPEEGLFRREPARAKASVTLGLRRHQALRAEQVSGIQRLIAAAVPGISVQDVTIVDSRGVALTRQAGSDSLGEVSHRLELKREVEQHLARKANQVLERAFGAGRALTSVDVTLKLDQVRVTTEDVTTPPTLKGTVPTGVVVRERETSKSEGLPQTGRGDTPIAPGSTHKEIEYQLGRRVEQVVAQPGSIERLHVVAVVQATLTAVQLEQMRALLAAAVGLSPQRGDVIVVQSLDSLTGGATAIPTTESGEAIAPMAASVEAPNKPSKYAESSTVVAGIAALLALVAFAALMLARGRSTTDAKGEASTLTESEREQLFARVERWLAEAPHER